MNDVPKSHTIAAGDRVKVLFTGVPGQVLAVHVTGGTFAADCSAKVQVLDPTGTPVTESVCGGRAVTLPVPALRTSGLFAVVLDNVSGAAGSLSLQIRASATSARTLTPNAGPFLLAIPVGQTREYGFRLERGEYLYADVNRWTWGVDEWSAELIAPDGSIAVRQWYQSLDDFEATVSGVYRLRINNISEGASGRTLDVVKGRHLSGTIVPGGPGVPVRLSLKGQRANYTFDAVKGQRLLATSTDASWSPVTSNPQAGLRVVGPDGRTMYNPSSNPDAANGLVQITGPHTLVVDPDYWATGSATVALRVTADPPRRTVEVGDTVTGELTEGQYAQFDFQATRGQTIRYRIESSAKGVVTFELPGADGAFSYVEPATVYEETFLVTRTGLWELMVHQYFQPGVVGDYSVSLSLESDKSLALEQSKRVFLEGRSDSIDVAEFYIGERLQESKRLHTQISGRPSGRLGLFLESEGGLSWFYLLEGDTKGYYSFDAPLVPEDGYYKISVVNLDAKPGWIKFYMSYYPY